MGRQRLVDRMRCPFQLRWRPWTRVTYPRGYRCRVKDAFVMFRHFVIYLNIEKTVPQPGMTFANALPYVARTLA